MSVQAFVPRLLLLVLCLIALPATAQSLGLQTHLSFGAFVVTSGGTVIVPASGVRSQSGGVVLMQQGGSASAAMFAVTGTPFATYSVSLPTNDSVVLSNGQGHTLSIQSFNSQPPGGGTLGSGGTDQLYVGATLAVNTGQSNGSYSGTFQITVNYQ
jgi:Domain of unknown function (DUF4402)